MSTEELVKALRHCDEKKDGCDDCAYLHNGVCRTLLSDAAQALEALQRAHGTWEQLPVEEKRPFSHRCSKCHRFHINEEEIYHYNYCPNCGAKMD